MFWVRIDILAYDIIGHVYNSSGQTIKICTAIILNVEYKSNEPLRIIDITMKNYVIYF